MKIYSRQAREIDSFDVYENIFSLTKVELIMMVLWWWLRWLITNEKR